jgi:hypothetical protein
MRDTLALWRARACDLLDFPLLRHIFSPLVGSASCMFTDNIYDNL